MPRRGAAVDRACLIDGWDDGRMDEWGSLDPPRKPHHTDATSSSFLPGQPRHEQRTEATEGIWPSLRLEAGTDGTRAGGGVDPDGGNGRRLAWIVLFALSRNPRDFSPVTNCRPRRASQPALTRPPSLAFAYRSTRFNDDGRPPSVRSGHHCVKFSHCGAGNIGPSQQYPWGKVGGFPAEFTQPLSSVCMPRNISEYQLLRVRFVSSRFVLSSSLPSFLPHSLAY